MHAGEVCEDSRDHHRHREPHDHTRRLWARRHAATAASVGRRTDRRHERQPEDHETQRPPRTWKDKS